MKKHNKKEDNCRICKSDDKYVFCNNCGLYHKYNINNNQEFYKKEYRELIGEKLDEDYFYSRKLVNRNRFNYIKENICFIELGNSLDIGCSEGSFVEIMKEYGFNSYGVEPNIKYSKFNKNENIKNTGFETYKTDKKFSIITMWHVFEHLNEPIEILRKVRYLLEKEGYIIIEVPNTDCKFCKSSDFIDEHTYYFNANNLSFLLKNIGFDIINISTTSDDINVVSSDLAYRFKSSIILKKIYHIFLPIINKLRFGIQDKDMKGANLRIIAKKI